MRETVIGTLGRWVHPGVGDAQDFKCNNMSEAGQCEGIRSSMERCKEVGTMERGSQVARGEGNCSEDEGTCESRESPGSLAVVAFAQVGRGIAVHVGPIEVGQMFMEEVSGLRKRAAGHDAQKEVLAKGIAGRHIEVSVVKVEEAVAACEAWYVGNAVGGTELRWFCMVEEFGWLPLWRMGNSPSGWVCEMLPPPAKQEASTSRAWERWVGVIKAKKGCGGDGVFDACESGVSGSSPKQRRGRRFLKEVGEGKNRRNTYCPKLVRNAV
ncbi:hypothetical protein DFJ73DRAFT_769591 [Zopfochytrium polystomum]|nr:hypothetical protein DFJ73DRAFT_769591 [Zopfochytrium polystomum]